MGYNMQSMSSKLDLKVEVVDNVRLAGGTFRLRAEAPAIAAIARPGQFCMIRPEYSGDSLLRRPFSIAAVRDEAVLEFAYTVVGKGTNLLSRMKPGENLLCMGPLGNSFPVAEPGRKAIVVAGGIGVAPFPFLNSFLNRHRIFPVTYYGARTASELIYLEELNQLSEELHLATDDGSSGFHGFVTQLLEKSLDADSSPSVLYACGPHPMLAKVKQIAERRDIPAYLSMEEKMGCGIGICVGCPIPGVTPEGENTNFLCCKDGPIFPSTVVRL